MTAKTESKMKQSIRHILKFVFFAMVLSFPLCPEERLVTAYAQDASASSDTELLHEGNWTRLAGEYPSPYASIDISTEAFGDSDAGKWEKLVKSYSEPAGTKTNARPTETLAQWWDVLSDDTLTQLIDGSLKENRTLEIARSKVRESRAALGIGKAAFLPWLDSSNSWARGKTSQNSGGRGHVAELYRLGLDASWEIDLWGQQRENVKAAGATLEADYAMLHSAWVTLSSEVAMTYISLRTLQERLAIAEKNLALRQETLKMLESQYASGLTNSLALSQAQYSVEQSKAVMPVIRTNLEMTLNALAILVGRVPGSLGEMLENRRSLPNTQSVDLTGIPAESLRQRPDIRAAERRLAAQIARTKSAEKDLFPKLSLFGSIGLESLSSGSLFSSDSVSYSFGPRISLPIFHGGAIRKNIQVQSAREEQLLSAYEQSVLAAVAEVRDALTANTQEKERNAALMRGVEAARNAQVTAEDLYRQGLTDFNNVILTQQALLALEEEYAVSEGQMVSNIVRIFKALGGGWAPLAAENRERPSQH